MSSEDGAGEVAEQQPTGKRLLRRAERREQIIGAAKRSFGRSGFAATSLEDVAGEAGVSKVIIYRHFDSKVELYRAALDNIALRVEQAVGGIEGIGAGTLEAMLRVAHADPDGFQLLFSHAAREPEFRSYSDELSRQAELVAARRLRERLPDKAHAEWAGRLVHRVVIESVISWLAAGQPGTVESATATIKRLVDEVTDAIRDNAP
jgi:AcrR family transcriptional regulator